MVGIERIRKVGVVTKESRPRRRSGHLIALACVSLFVGTAMVIVQAFQVGIVTGLVLAGAGIVACAAPLSLIGLPVPGLSGLVDRLAALVSGFVSAVLSFLRSLFD